MLDAVHHAGRPRPVAGLASPAGRVVAKAWLLGLLTHTALEDVAAFPTALVAREGPALCDAVLAAVGDDAALDRLCADGDLGALAARVGALAGAESPAAVVAAVETLRTVLHRALRSDRDAALAADTGDRLAHVCAQVAITALTGVAAPSAPASGSVSAASATAPGLDPRALVARDLRAAGASATALERVLEGRGKTPVAVLAIELDDLERLVAVAGPTGLACELAALEGALTHAGGEHGVLVREEPGRWWLIVPRVGTDAARALAQRCSTLVGAHAPLRHHVGLRASIGVAVCPDDGADATALCGHAEQGVFTARALGVGIA